MEANKNQLLVSNMEKLRLALILLSLLPLHSTAETLISSPKRITRLCFYLHDVIGGDKPTVWEVAKSNLTDILPSAFGQVFVLDNLVTWDPDIDSAPVGRMQGMVGLSDLRETALDMLLNLVFAGGEYDGSTLSIVGRNPLGREVREVSIVAGAGVFRMASGYIIISTYFSDPARVHDVYEYNAVVFHYDSDALLTYQ